MTSLLLPSHSQSQGYAQPLYKSSVIAEEENSTTSSGGDIGLRVMMILII